MIHALEKLKSNIHNHSKKWEIRKIKEKRCNSLKISQCLSHTFEMPHSWYLCYYNTHNHPVINPGQNPDPPPSVSGTSHCNNPYLRFLYFSFILSKLTFIFILNYISFLMCKHSSLFSTASFSDKWSDQKILDLNKYSAIFHNIKHIYHVILYFSIPK